MFVEIKVEGKVLDFLVDTGATVTLVSKSAIDKNKARQASGAVKV